MTKFTHHHNLPVAQIRHRNPLDVPDTSPIVLHIVESVHNNGTDYRWHTRCGKNMNNAPECNGETLAYGLAGSQYISFCSKCGTVADFTSAFETLREYEVEERRLRRENERIKAEKCKREWEEMIATFHAHIYNEGRFQPYDVVTDDVDNKVTYVIDGFRDPEKKYKITVSISEMEE